MKPASEWYDEEIAKLRAAGFEVPHALDRDAGIAHWREVQRDAAEDTLRRCVSFAKQWGLDGFAHDLPRAIKIPEPKP